MDINIVGLIIVWLVTAVSLIIISRLGVGIDIADFKRALVAALVIGLINAVFGALLGGILGAGIIVKLIVNALLFWLAAAVVDGFSLRNGFWSALIGSVLLTLISEVIFWLLGAVGLG